MRYDALITVTMTCDAPDVFDSCTLYWVDLQHAFQQVNGRLVEMFRHREQTSYKHSQTHRQTDRSSSLICGPIKHICQVLNSSV